MIYKELTLNDFKNEFIKFNRQNQFTNKGLEVIYDHLTDDVEFPKGFKMDVIEICCGITEYNLFADLKKDYDIDRIDDLYKETIVLCDDDDCIIFYTF